MIGKSGEAEERERLSADYAEGRVAAVYKSYGCCRNLAEGMESDST
ncbi:MAG: hypothetical protein MR430_07435 [Lachnospiraceae bacterium]|nr:hypothetical protein [Lachnospiraceae bacterium]